jgi:hypothetical protein
VRGIKVGSLAMTLIRMDTRGCHAAFVCPGYGVNPEKLPGGGYKGELNATVHVNQLTHLSVH